MANKFLDINGVSYLWGKVKEAINGAINSLGALASKSLVSEADLEASLKEKVNAASEGNHSHLNKAELDLITTGDVTKWNNTAADHLVAQDKTDLLGLINGKVGIEEGKSLVANSEISKLVGVSEGANKVEGSSNGYIKIDGVDTLVYSHPAKHVIDDVTGLQDALSGKQAAGNYSEVGHNHVKNDITDFAHTHVKNEITDFDHTHVTADITDFESKVNGIVDKVITDAVDGDTLTSLTELVEYLSTHGGKYAELAATVGEIEGKPAMGISADDIAAWNAEKGAKALAATKTTMSEVEAKGYITEAYLATALTDAEIQQAIDAVN